MGFFKSIKRLVDKVNNHVNEVMKVVDPVGGHMKEYTEDKSQKAVMNYLAGGNKQLAPMDTTVRSSGVVTDEKLEDEKDKKFDDIKRRRQGPGGSGATLLTTTDDDNQRLEKRTLLGL